MAMKKIVYIILALSTINGVIAQNATADKQAALKKTTIAVSDKSYMQYTKDREGVPLQDQSFYKISNGSRVAGDYVGYSSYDLVTNASAPNRLLVYPDNKVSAVWTGSTSTAEARTDRGTFFNNYDGANWGAIPDTRIEDYRTGFPAMINVGDHEMYFAHDGSNNLVIFKNDATGSTNWTEDANSLLLHGTWPRAACAQGSNYIHLLAANDDAANENDYMLYYRSSDGGATWDITHFRLPGIDTANGYSIMGAECYTIRAIGDNVYIAAGENINDLAVWKSNSNGDIGSWTRTRLIEWPIPNFNGNTISDIDADGVADTITSQDGNIALAIDNSGMMHVWTGATRILDVTPDDDGWSYFPGVTGLWYWNESFGADSVQYLDFALVDWDEDGDPFLGIGADLPNYGCGFTSQASATVDPLTGYIYVVYTHPVEFTDYFDDPTVAEAQSFRDLFGFYSTDGGISWSPPINLTYVAEQNFENVNPTVYWSTISNKVHVLWQQDQDPGTSTETTAPDAITLDNDVLYRAFDYSRFEPYDPTAEYDYSAAANVFTFNNLSVDADTYNWDFGDGSTSTQFEPLHAYTTTGNFLVCLNAENKYGDDQSCKTIEVTQTDIVNALPQLNISVFPTLTTGILHIETSELYEDLNVEVYNTLGQKLTTDILNGASNEINISNLNSGEYLLRFISHSAVTVKQVTLIK